MPLDLQKVRVTWNDRFPCLWDLGGTRAFLWRDDQFGAGAQSYRQALAASFARVYANDRALEEEGAALARQYPEEAFRDIERQMMGYRFEVYCNIRDRLGASHEEAVACVLGPQRS